MLAFMLLLADSVIAPGSGAAMCNALAPADFVHAGVPVTKLNPPHVDDDGASVYCDYGSTAGKVEMDVFYPAAPSPADAAKVEAVTIRETQGKYEPAKIAGADDAQIGTAGASALFVCRRGTAVVMISVPAAAHAQLYGLARMALARLTP